MERDGWHVLIDRRTMRRSRDGKTIVVRRTKLAHALYIYLYRFT